jgi:hypothetical protein
MFMSILREHHQKLEELENKGSVLIPNVQRGLEKNCVE